MKKLYIQEDLVNLMDAQTYDNVALLGYACTLASNDLHHIHLCAVGDKFQEIHEDAEKYMDRVQELGDFCFELAKEGGISLYNETYALDVLKDEGSDWQVADKNTYDFIEAYTQISNILSDLCEGIKLVQETEGIKSDVASELDTYLREFTKDVNYFINKKLYKSEDDILVSGNANESYRKICKKLKRKD